MRPERNFNDSGHNFLGCMNGRILVGRHLSYTAIRGRVAWSFQPTFRATTISWH
jgi:hypothetical protein